MTGTDGCEWAFYIHRMLNIRIWGKGYIHIWKQNSLFLAVNL